MTSDGIDVAMDKMLHMIVLMIQIVESAICHLFPPTMRAYATEVDGFFPDTLHACRMPLPLDDLEPSFQVCFASRLWPFLLVVFFLLAALSSVVQVHGY